MKKCLLLFLFLGANYLFAQKTTPESVHQLDGGIEKMWLTEAGILLVIGNSGVAGIKPGEPKPFFTFNEYGKIKSENVEAVPQSPYIIVSKDAKLLSTATKRAVIDIISGETIFDTDQKGWHAINTVEVFLPQNKLIVSGTRKEKQKNGGPKVEISAVGMYDLVTGDQEGFAYLDPKFREKGKVSTMGAAHMITGTPAWANDRIFTPTRGGVVCVDIKSGDVLWEAKIKNLAWMVTDETGNEVYGFEEKQNNTRIHKFNAKDGAEIWDKERKIKGKISQFSILPQGIAVVGDLVKEAGSSKLGKIKGGKAESYISFLDATTGKDLWEKTPKTKGIIQHFYIQDDGILFGMQQGGVNKVSFDGNTLFKKPLKTGENIHIMGTTPLGVIYITETDAGIFNEKTGDPVWKKPIKYKKASSVAATYDEAHQRYLISTGSEIIAIDENTGDVGTLATLKFDEKEVPVNISVRPTGIFLNSSQNMTLLNFDGTEIYHRYFKSPGRSLAGKIVMGTIAAASIVGATASYMQAGDMSEFAYQTDWQKRNEATGDALAGIASLSFEIMSKRFKASSATYDHQFILTKLPDGVGLVKVNKDDGETKHQIILQDKNPVYEVDDLGGYLFYKSGNKEVSAFKL